MLLLCSSFFLGKISIFKAQLQLGISMIRNKGWWVKVLEKEVQGIEGHGFRCGKSIPATPASSHSTNPSGNVLGRGEAVLSWVIPRVLISAGPQLWREGMAGKKGYGEAPAAEYLEREEDVECGEGERI